MPKFSGIDSSNISGFSGKAFIQSGVSSVPVTTNSGLLLCPYNASPVAPYHPDMFADYINPIHMWQWSSRTDVSQVVSNNFHVGLLTSSGDVYVSGYNYSSSMGVTGGYSGGGDFVQSNISNVVKLRAHYSGFMAIKSDGSLWYTGSVSNYISGASSATNQWLRYGTDSDWHDIQPWTGGYPYTIIAIKGAARSRYLYAIGYQTNYGTGQGTTSGTLTSWTRVKSAASTDLNVSFSSCSACYGACAAISEDGDLYVWGEGQNGNMLDGSSADEPYAVERGTTQTWSKVIQNRYGFHGITTDGKYFVSTSFSGWKCKGGANNLTLNQVGTDTDYEDFVVDNISTNGNDIVQFVKKNGAWYMTQGYALEDGGWHGKSASDSQFYPQNETWYTVNQFMFKNDITGTLQFPYIIPGQGARNAKAEILFVVT